MTKILKVKFKDIESTKTLTPVLTYCRELIAAGEDPNSRLEVYRDSDEPDIIALNIGEAAKLGVSEESGCRFRKYSPPSPSKGGLNVAVNVTGAFK